MITEPGIFLREKKWMLILCVCVCVCFFAKEKHKKPNLLKVELIKSRISTFICEFEVRRQVTHYILFFGEEEAFP